MFGKYKQVPVKRKTPCGAVTYHRPFKNGQTFEGYSNLENFERCERRYGQAWEADGKNAPYGLVAKVIGQKYPPAIDTLTA